MLTRFEVHHFSVESIISDGELGELQFVEPMDVLLALRPVIHDVFGRVAVYEYTVVYLLSRIVGSHGISTTSALEDLQLSRSSRHSCSSMGYFVRSISQATVEVILEAAQNMFQIEFLKSCAWLDSLWKKKQEILVRQSPELPCLKIVNDEQTLRNCPPAGFCGDICGLKAASAVPSVNILLPYRRVCYCPPERTEKSSSRTPIAYKSSEKHT